MKGNDRHLKPKLNLNKSLCVFYHSGNKVKKKIAKEKNQFEVSKGQSINN